MLVLIFLVLGILIFETLGSETIQRMDSAQNIFLTLFVIDATACSVFMVEFFLRMSVAQDKWWFWKSNWIDFVSSIPFPPGALLDANTWGRTVRLVRILRIWRAFRILSFTWRGMERLQQIMDVRLMKKSLVWSGVAILIGALGVYYLEEPGDPAIASLPQSIWWSFNALATGGFADLYPPQSMVVQVITAGLIIVGLMVIGVFIATLSATYRGEFAKKLEIAQHDLQDDLARIIGAQQEISQRLDMIEQQQR